MQYTRGEYILMVDADGATRFSDLDPLLTKLRQTEQNGLGVAVGSRAHLVKTDAVVKVKGTEPSLALIFFRWSKNWWQKKTNHRTDLVTLHLTLTFSARSFATF